MLVTSGGRGMNVHNVASYKMRVYSWYVSISIVMLHAAAYFSNCNSKVYNTNLTSNENIISFLSFIGTLSMAYFFFSSSSLIL